MSSSSVIYLSPQLINFKEKQMNDETATSQWTEEDEAIFQALQDDANEKYEESVGASYASRGQANLY
jgi:hypothetical protein